VACQEVPAGYQMYDNRGDEKRLVFDLLSLFIVILILLSQR
jgi:hypothetical protein